MTISALRSSSVRRWFSRRSFWISSSCGLRLDLGPRLCGVRPLRIPACRSRRQVTRCEVKRPSRRRRAPIAPGCAAATSASVRMRCLYSAVKVRRLASTTTSGSGRGEAGGSAATVLPATALREASLRSASLRSAAGKTVGEAGEIPLFFTLIPILALLSNYDQENCLINVGTEGELDRPSNQNPPLHGLDLRVL